ncbi:MAG: ABC transporter permease [Cyanobacteria bacterium]|nr:ABC transporter permease [Cyanobacteriota bacterium]
MGIAVAGFVVVHTVLWAPLPYPRADRLVLLTSNLVKASTTGLRPGEVAALNDASRTLEHVASISSVEVTLNKDGELDLVRAAMVDAGVLPLLGAVPPAMGRGFDPALDDGPVIRTAIISDQLWRSRFQSDPSVLGRRIRINNLEVEVIAVLAPDVRVFLPDRIGVPEMIDVWLFLSNTPDWRNRSPVTLARLRYGTTLTDARAELAVLAARFAMTEPAAYPPSDYTDGAPQLRADALHQQLTAEAEPGLLAFGGATLLMLLVGSVNVINLMLVRLMQRQRDAAVRSTLGASAARLWARHTGESALLVAAGGVAGLLVAHATIASLAWLNPVGLPKLSLIVLDPTGFAFGAALCLLILAAFAILPAINRRDDVELRALTSTRYHCAAPRWRIVRYGLVTIQVATAVAAVVGSALMSVTFWNLTHTPLGFEPAGLMATRVPVSLRAMPEVERRIAFHSDLLTQVRQLPGVVSAAAAAPLPLAPGQDLRPVGRADDDGSGRIEAAHHVMFPGALGTFNTKLLEGRDFSHDDLVNGRRVALVDRRLADRLWPNGAIGQQLAIHGEHGLPPLEIIGVTNAIRSTDVRDDGMAHVFLPYHLHPREMSVLIRTSRDSSDLDGLVRAIVMRAGTGRPLSPMHRLTDYFDDAIARERFTMLMLLGFAATTVLLAGVGLYGILAYAVSIRAGEFSVRLALGSTRMAIVALVAREGALIILSGLVAGAAGSVVVAQSLASLVYGAAPLSAEIVVPVLATIGATTATATLAPALRASGIDPASLLRQGAD